MQNKFTKFQKSQKSLKKKKQKDVWPGHQPDLRSWPKNVTLIINKNGSCSLKCDLEHGSWSKKIWSGSFKLDHDPKENLGHDRDPVTIHDTNVFSFPFETNTKGVNSVFYSAYNSISHKEHLINNNFVLVNSILIRTNGYLIPKFCIIFNK